jgi:hypothetical protein
MLYVAAAKSTVYEESCGLPCSSRRALGSLPLIHARPDISNSVRLATAAPASSLLPNLGRFAFCLILPQFQAHDCSLLMQHTTVGS